LLRRRLFAMTRALPPMEMFDKQALARYFRVSTDTIDRLVKANLLRAVKIGNQVRFTPEDVEAFIERQRIRGEAA
jgi:excisionase family DNA binding protein